MDTQRTVGYCTLCRSRCGTVNLVENGRLVSVEPLSAHPTGGAMCTKGRAAPELLHSPERLAYPMRRTQPKESEDPGWERISWDEALETIAARLAEVREVSGAESVAFAVTTGSGTPIVDSGDWIERLVRIYGSPNLVYGVEICGWHKDYAHALTFGRGIGTPDYQHAELIMLWGHNPARTWLKQATRVADARRRGASVVVIDPKRSGSGDDADLWLGIRPGADGALAMGAIKHLIDSRTYDAPFVRAWTNAPALIDRDTGEMLVASEVFDAAPADALLVWHESAGLPRIYDTRYPLENAEAVLLEGDCVVVCLDGSRRRCYPVFQRLVDVTRVWDVEQVVEHTWLKKSDVEAFFALLRSSRKVAYHSWTGLGQQANATQTERTIATLYALLGACDREGGNLWLNQVPANVVNHPDLLSDTQRKKALGLDLLPLGPPRLGWITVRDFSRAVLEGEPYRVRALINFGMNFVVSQADTERSLSALRALDFQVHMDVFMTPTAQTADIVLPATLPWEREALKIGFEIDAQAVEHVQLRQAVVPPYAEARTDYDVVIELARRLGHDEAFFGATIEAGWAHQLAPSGVTLGSLRENPGGLRVPVVQAFEKYAGYRPDGTVVGFATPSRRVEFFSTLLKTHGHDPFPNYVEAANSTLTETRPYMLTTAKNGYFMHSQGRHQASLRRRSPDPCIDLSPSLAAHIDVSPGDWVRVETDHGIARLRVRLDASLHALLAVAEYGWWNACAPLGRPGYPVVGAVTSNINAVFSDITRDPISGSVPFRAVACDIRREVSDDRCRWFGPREFRLLEKRVESRDITSFVLRATDGVPIRDYLPGQHLVVSMPGSTVKRAYSITSVAVGSADISISVKRVTRAGEDGRSTDGVLSSYLHDRFQVEDVISLEPPGGNFTLPISTRRPILLIAGGVGITPFIGYLRALLDEKHPPPRVILLYGCSDGDRHAFGQELESLCRALPFVAVHTWYSAPGSRDLAIGNGIQSGRMTLDHIDPDFIALRPLAYLCGPLSMMEALIGGLIERGIPKFDIFKEQFAVARQEPVDMQPRQVALRRSGKRFEWTPADGSLLEAAEKSGAVLASGCRVGQCESCVVPLLSGTVWHAVALESLTEKDCLTCQAYPLSDLVLDC